MVQQHLPCPDCSSSDALCKYEDHTWCFSCSTYRALDLSSDLIKKDVLTFPENSSRVLIDNHKITEKVTMSSTYSSWRGVSKSTMEFYSVVTMIDNNKLPLEVIYKYPNGAEKHRSISEKRFWSTGPMSEAGLFGMDKFSPGYGKAITITEGELDCLSVYQMMGSKYPCVTFKASSSASKECAANYKYLDSFDKIYLCLDNDEVGNRTTKEIASLFDPNKVYIVELGAGCKDANDYLTKGRQEEFVKLWWNAKKYLPKGIVNEYSAIKEILGRQSSTSLATYPFPTLNEMTYGIREGELNLFTAQEKVGKTEIIRAIEHHLLKTTDYNIGIIHLEEGEKRSVQGLLSYELDVPVHLPDSSISVDDQLKAYATLTKRESRLNFYTHFGSDDPDTILGALRYMVTALGCKFIFLDHITMLVTGYEGDDERRKLDYISTRLAMLTRELKFTLFLVSHVNDDGKTRGSRNISKVADLIVHLDRNPEADSLDGRNTTSVLVKGNRFAARSGPAGYLWFDPSKYQVKEKVIDDVLVTLPEPF